MKATILAVILIIGGVPNLFQSDTAVAGLIATLAGVLIIIYKIMDKAPVHDATYDQIKPIPADHTPEVRVSVSDSTVSEWEENQRRCDAVDAKWKLIIDQHRRLSEEIGVAYTIANNLDVPNGPQMQKVIELCEQDIAIAEKFKLAQFEIAQEYVRSGIWDQDCVGSGLPFYPSFKRLAIIYEKQHEYDKAIEVCETAIRLGYIDDGTEGQMPGRIARLIRKKGKPLPSIKSSQHIVVENETDEK